MFIAKNLKISTNLKIQQKTKLKDLGVIQKQGNLVKS